jgi:hypothetical protein
MAVTLKDWLDSGKDVRGLGVKYNNQAGTVIGKIKYDNLGYFLKIEVNNICLIFPPSLYSSLEVIVNKLR